MTPDTIFLICNYGVIPAWLLLAFAPSWAGTQRIVHAVWIPMLLGVVYLGLFVFGPPGPAEGSFSSLAGVTAFFSVPETVLVGWVHYLAFDLFVGAWEVRDAQRRSISHLYVVPCLLFTLMLGPVGLLAYLTLRFASVRVSTLDEAVA